MSNYPVVLPENRERTQFLRQIREALVRQRGGPFDRGDLSTIMEGLEGLLDDIRDGWLVFVQPAAD